LLTFREFRGEVCGRFDVNVAALLCILFAFAMAPCARFPGLVIFVKQLKRFPERDSWTF
jgi:hypothetical protein